MFASLPTLVSPFVMNISSQLRDQAHPTSRLCTRTARWQNASRDSRLHIKVEIISIESIKPLTQNHAAHLQASGPKADVLCDDLEFPPT